MLELRVTGNVGTCRLVKASGKSPVLNISLATNRKVGEREFVDWTSVKVWGKGRKNSPHTLEKGTKLLITGRPEARPFKANDGTAKAELVVHANDIEFLSGKGKHDPGDEPDHAEDEELPLATA